jgi:hypothetical protein
MIPRLALGISSSSSRLNRLPLLARSQIVALSNIATPGAPLIDAQIRQSGQSGSRKSRQLRESELLLIY